MQNVELSPGQPGRVQAQAQQATSPVGRSLAPWAGPVLVTLALYLLMLLGVLNGFGFNPTGPIRIGSNFDGSRYWDDRTIVIPGTGYDGQFFYYIALDPLLRAEDVETFIDAPAYRYGRILYPALVWLAALGQPAAVPWALLFVNLVAVIVGTLAAVDVLRSLGVRRWFALAFAFSPAVVFGVVADLSEPLSLAFVAVGLALYLRERHVPAGLAFGLAALAREPSALVALGFCLYFAGQRRWRPALSYSLPLAIPAAWHALVWLRLGILPSAQSPHNFGPPLSGAIHRALVLLDLQKPVPGTPEPVGAYPELLAVLLSAAIIIWGLLVLRRRRDVLAWQLWLHAALGLFTAPPVWMGLGSYLRVLGLLFLFAGLVMLTERGVERPAPLSWPLPWRRRREETKPAAS